MSRWRPALAWLAALALAVLLPLARPASADPTPPTLGGDMMSCFLATPAFCDDFSEGAYTGSAANRGGDLDPARWSFSRLTSAENPGQGQAFTFPPVTAQFCRAPLPGVLPDRDSFMCNAGGAEDMHWMTAINDGGEYVVNGARSLQPFDIAGRTGTVAFMVDAVTRGWHSTWPDVVLVDQPIPDPHEQKPGVDSPPRNGVEIDFNQGCGTPSQVNPSDGAALADYPQTTVGQVSLFTNDGEKDWNAQALGALPCVAALADHPNLIVLQYSQRSLDVWMADAIANMVPGVPMPPPPLTHVLHLDGSDGYALDMTRGYLSFQQAQYNAAKFNGDAQRTYHWHAIGFDGPQLPADQVAEVRDSLTPAPGGAVNIGYQVSDSRSWIVQGVQPAGSAAYVTFNVRTDQDPVPPIAVRVNGGAAIPAQLAPGTGGFQATAAYAPVPLADLVAGANTVEIDAPSAVVANIDLGVQGDPPPVATATASPTPAPTATNSPTPAPTSTPTATASASPTPGSLLVNIGGAHYACSTQDGGATYQCVRP